MKTTSRFALAAAAGLFVGAMAFTPAKAADLGGDCCADLEERVAELEATSARKGNRVVSLQVYGQVNRALMYWDDGEEEDLFHIDNDHSSSRLGMRGTGALKPGWTVGYDVQWNIQVADSSAVSQEAFQANDSNRPVAWDIRRAEVYFDSSQFGRLTVGQGSSASDGTSEVDLGYANYSNDTLYNGGFVLRGDDGADELTWFDLGFNLDGQSRQNRVRYDSPSIYGFILSASAGADDYYDVALRFSKEWNSIRVAAAVAYSETEDDSPDGDGPDTETVNGSFSIMHTPSGLFFTGGAGQRDTDGTIETGTGCDSDTHDAFAAQGCVELLDFPGSPNTADFDELGEYAYDRDDQEATFYSAKAGISRNWTGMGNTTIFGLYGYFEDFAKGELVGLAYQEGPGGDNQHFVNEGYRISSSEVDRYAFGINQAFDNAATDIYLHFEYNEADIEGVEIADDRQGNIVDAAGATSETLDTEEWFGVVLGTKIKF